MDTFTKAASPEQIAAAQAKLAATSATAKQIAPAGFEGSKSVPLTVAIEFEGRTYTAINLRKLKGRDFLKLQQLGENEDMGLLALISDAPAEVLAELDADDFMTLSEEAKSFLPRRLQTAIEQISASGQNTPR
ncbi:MAG: phage tail assembly protein [Alphaproteobacteria bacterium]|nr:phage tail assembly protein [Alphaproteobacteria bacterium]